MLVLVDHWRNLFFVRFRDLGAGRLVFAVPYVLTAAGHQAVVIFFVLSGFLIARTIRHAFDRGEWSWISYLIHRLVRLWIVLLPGLALCLLWDKIGAALPAMQDVARGDTAIALIGNLFFLQGVLVPAFGSDGPLWSLANEFWYYILFPLGLSALLPSIRPSTRLISAALVVLLCTWLRTTLLPLFPIWLLGAALPELPRPSFGTSVRWLAAGIYAAVIFLCTHLYLSLGIVSDYMLAVATAIFFWILLSASERAPSDAVRVRFCRGIARFSYTLYVVHLPLLMLIAALLVGHQRWQPTSVHIAAALGILAAALGYAYLIASFTEFRTASTRAWVEQCFRAATARRATDG